MPADWDWMAISGLLVAAAGLWMLWGPGAALVLVGVVMVLVGVGAAMTRR